MSRQLALRFKDPETLVLTGLDGFLAAVLKELVSGAEPSGKAAERLFPSPTETGDKEIVEDWKEFVRPELEALFRSHREVVEGDLAKMRKAGFRGFECEIPAAHAPAWVHALNQARLSLSATHELGEAELDGERPGLEGARAFAAFQVQFYGLLQEWLLAAVDDV